MKRRIRLGASMAGALLSFLAGPPTGARGAEPKEWIAYVGTYTRKESKGIYAFHFDAATGRLSPLGLAAETKSPSFLAPSANGRFLYVSNELTRTTGGEGPAGLGWISAFAFIPGDFHLRFINRQSSGGEGPAHIAVDAENHWVYTAHYNSGNVGAFPVNPDGSAGSGGRLVVAGQRDRPQGPPEGPPRPLRRARSRRAFPLFVRLGRRPGDDLCPLGGGEGATWSGARSRPSVAVPPGSGPRHLALAPGTHRAYVVNEIRVVGERLRLERNGRDRLLAQRVQTSVPTLPAGWSGASASAELQLSPDGRFLYVSNRGHDSIARFAVGADGTLALDRDDVPCGGRTPRFLTLDPTGRFLLVADEGSDLIQVFRRDPASGALTALAGDIGHVSMPACIVFVPVGARG